VWAELQCNLLVRIRQGGGTVWSISVFFFFFFFFFPREQVCSDRTLKENARIRGMVCVRRRRGIRQCEPVEPRACAVQNRGGAAKRAAQAEAQRAGGGAVVVEMRAAVNQA